MKSSEEGEEELISSSSPLILNKNNNINISNNNKNNSSNLKDSNNSILKRRSSNFFPLTLVNKMSNNNKKNGDINLDNSDSTDDKPNLDSTNTNQNNNNNNNPKTTHLNVNTPDNIKEENNLTKSDPTSPTGGGTVEFENNQNNDNSSNSSGNPNNNNNSPNKPLKDTLQHPLQNAQSYPDNIGKYVSPLSRAQELPYSNQLLDDSGVSMPPEDSSDDDDDDEGQPKKKKTHFFKTLFSYKVIVIIILVILILLSGVGVVFKIFWEHITIVDVILLRWALYLDVCIAGYLVVSWIIHGLISLFETTLYLQQHVYYYINGLTRPLSSLFWAIIVYFTTDPILQLPSYTDDDMDKYFISLRAVMYVSLFYCARVALVKILAARTNRKAFYTSLKKSLLDEELLEQLSTKKSSSHLSQSVSSSLKKKKKMGITQWIDSIKLRSQLSLKLNANRDNYSEKEAKKVAKLILCNADRNKKGYLDIDDLKLYVKDKHAQKAFDTFATLNSDRITKYDITKWVLRVVKHRKTLELRLRDHEDIGRVINEIINFFFWILIFLFVLTLYGVEVSVFLVPLSTTILGLSFAFGTTLRNVFESLILIFFVRPFEVGDKVVVGTLDGLIVDRIGILFTSFKSLDGKAVYLPNSSLVISRIENHQRSEEVWVGIDLVIDFTTPVEKLYAIESKMEKWVRAQPEKWRPDISLTFVGFDGTNYITIRYGASVIASWQDGKRWRPIKNELFFKMKEWLHEGHLETHPPTQRYQMLPPITTGKENNNNAESRGFKWPDNY
ncbi:putative transmembrane protein [Tieghemostelium lacteum]|uniref:Putative transmembrane protein n=1 Tax=Tieghemostelium lacteum TaxID=361077 RepID=A0A151Z6A9_TIELA|nr:putative transmembrane protein [Tieghemostelium lacteum]|eukprot:KYQ89467.1 putative transmembrane protein [Tieghemostelium lacteum]